MQFSSDVSGLQYLQKVLSQLPRATARRIIMPALREGGDIVKKQAKANVQSIANKGYATGSLEKNIQMYNYKKFKGMYRVGVQVRRRAVNQKKIVNGQPVRIGLYASVLEYGKNNQPPRSWIRSALRSKESQAISAVVTYLRTNFYKAIGEAKK